MPYDPEYSLKLQRHLDVVRAAAESAAEIMGQDNLVVQFVEAMNSALEILVARVLDYEECYDPERQEVLRGEINLMVQELSEITKEIHELRNDLRRI